MTEDGIRTSIVKVLSRIAPEASVDTLDPTGSIQEQLDLDSMDFLNFVSGLDQELGVDVPERDYEKIATLNGCIDYVGAHAR